MLDERPRVRFQKLFFPYGALMLYALLIWARLPVLFSDPRFWAEEGTVFFGSALEQPFLGSLFMVRQGYFNLIDNVAGIIAARAVPLERAPVVTLMVSLLIQLLPAWLILTSRIEVLRSRTSQTMALGVILLSIPDIEIWLNTSNCQFHLAVSVFIILISAAQQRRYAILGRAAVLLMSGLTGIASVLLAPFFMVRAAVERTRARVIEAAVLTFSMAVQGVAVMYAISGGARGISFDPNVYACVLFVKSILLPLGGFSTITDEISDTVFRAAASGHTPALVYLTVLMAVGVLGVMAFRSRCHEARIAWMAFLWITVISFVGGIDAEKDTYILPQLGGRYFYVPNVCLGLLLVMLVSREGARSAIARSSAAVVLIWVLIMGGYDYIGTRRNPYYEQFTQGPSWRAGVAAWRMDHALPIRIWPESWTVEIPAAPDKSGKTGTH